MKLEWARVDAHYLDVPSRATPGAAGYDLQAAKTTTVLPRDVVLVPTGWAVAIPDGYVGVLAVRSGTSVKNKISLVNGCGIIDSDYRGEVMLAMINHSNTPVEFPAGARVGQLVLVPILAIESIEVERLPLSSRGTGGFGSTGV
jgi:dUTP pyrophosphatase